MPAYQLTPTCKSHPWGGRRSLREDFAVSSDLNPLAEAWVLSCRPDDPSVIKGGAFNGTTLPDFLSPKGPKALGTLVEKLERFPILIKLIDAEQKTPVQVCPSGRLWVVLEAKPGTYLYHGLEKEITEDELESRAKAGTLTELLHKVPAQKGGVFLLPAGTLFAIGAGVVLAEIQEDSGADDAQPETANLSPVAPADFGGHLGVGPCFTVDRYVGTFNGVCGKDSFHVLLVADGGATLYCDGEHKTLDKGGCFFLPAGVGDYRVEGHCEILTVRCS